MSQKHIKKTLSSINSNSLAPLLEKASSLFSMGRHEQAIKILNEILIKENESEVALQLLFDIYTKDEQLFESYRIAKRLFSLNASADNQYQLAILCTRIGKIEEAKSLLQQYVEKNQTNAFAYLNLGHMQKAFKEFDDAANSYNQFVALEPNRIGYAVWNLADLKDRNISDQELSFWLEKEKDGSQDKVSCLLIQFSLGFLYEKQGKYDKAFEYFEKANAANSSLVPFNNKAFYSFINGITQYQTANEFGDKLEHQDEVTPIFILGLPRSGSTLVEQILASHSEVNATDELNFIGHTAAKLERTGNYAKAISSLTEKQLAQIRSEYLTYAGEYQSIKNRFFIDKNPLNFLHIGLILKLFPNAVIIHTHRQLLDNAMSLYKRYFYIGHDYSYSLSDIVTFIEGYTHVMKHWDEVFPGKIYHSRYEDLVADSESKIKALLAFCELGEQDSCFTFYKQKRTVLTPSVDQVNKPINSSSIDSWKKYQHYVNPFQAKLEEINQDLLSLGKDVTKEAWNDYWQQGHITTFGKQYENNYTGVVANTWAKYFDTLEDDSRVLDVATGNGAVLDLALRLLPDSSKVELVGIDYAKIKSQNERLSLLSEVNVEYLPFEENSFSHVTSQYGIEYSKFEKSIPELARVIKPLGTFQFICHSCDSLILENNKQIKLCTQELLKFGGAICILKDMLLALSKKAENNSSDIGDGAEQFRNALNTELGRLQNLYGEALHETTAPLLLKEVLKGGISYEKQMNIITSFVSEQRIALTRLSDLANAAITPHKLRHLMDIAEKSGFSEIDVKIIEEQGVGLLGLILTSHKKPN